MSSEPLPANVNTPVNTIRKHSLKAAIWRNDTRAGVIYNVTLIRTYRNGEGFTDTPSLGFDDLANAAKLLLDAESWITWQILRDKGKPQSKALGTTEKTTPVVAEATASPPTPKRRSRAAK